MEKVWKFMCLCLVVSFFKLCNGLPIHLESTIPADPSVELLSEVIVILLTVCTVLLLVGCLCCHRPSGFKEFRDSPVAVSTVSNVDNGLVNPSAEGAFTIFAPLGQNFSSSNDRLRLEEEYSYGDINVSSWFNEGVYDFPRTKLKYIKELGKGWFGSVVEGTAQDPENHTWTPVVVRILDSTASTKEKVFFLHEAEIYKCGNHTNLLKLHGRCLNSAPYLLLQELCTQGDLKGYLLSNRGNNNLLVSEYPLIWCCQIASALKFLHEKGLAHSDLACRNCQLTSNLTVKLGDYGLSSSKYPEDYYEGIPTISVRWCAPESIKHTSTTIQPERITREANVWSLAVCFWEICECGARPYADLSDDEVVTQVLGKAHVRLPRPSRIVLYTDYIYGLMQSCWLTPESRPTSTQIYLTLTDLLQVFTVCKSESKDTTSLEGSQESFDLRWNSLKPNNAGNLEFSNDKTEVKPMSPSMNNLIGSLDDMNRSRTSEEDNAHSVLLPGKTDQKFEFELSTHSKEPLETDSLDDSMVYNMRRSSSSETEEENWKRKIERGAYTEKVRQKSRSVTDLMVLTHIDCSESESETPQPSLDHRVNYKNVRLAPKHNLESASYVHGSEGNLLSVQDDFQAELRKLQEGHRDSLFFVPDKYSQTLRNEQVNNNLDVDRDIRLGDSSNERLVKELSGTSDITPVNQVYNVFNVTIDNLSPIHVVKLNEIINLEESLEFGENKTFISYEVPKLCDIIQNNSMVATYPDNLDPSCLNGNQDENSESYFYDDDIRPENIEESSVEETDIGHSSLQSKELSLRTEDKNNDSKPDNSFPDNSVSPHFSDVCPPKIEESSLEQTEIGQTFLLSEEPSLRNSDSPMENSRHEIGSNYTEEVMETEKQEVLVVGLSSKTIENNNDLGTIDETFKTEESHVDERYCEIKIDDKHDILSVPDNEIICDESVLNDEIVLHCQEGVSMEENPMKNEEIGVNQSFVRCESENHSMSGSIEREEIGSARDESGKNIDKGIENVQLVLSPSENFVNIEKVQNSVENYHVPEKEGLETEEGPVLKLEERDSMDNKHVGTAESLDVSPADLEDSLESVDEEKDVVESIVVSETSSLKNRNTLEDLFVFQMGENLNSFEMNSQISDTDFSLTPERCMESMDTINEEIDSEEFPQPKKHEEESVSKKRFMKKLGDMKKESIKKVRQEDAGAKSFQVPKLMDLIENNDKLMDYIITNYESELHDDLSCENTVVIEKSDGERDYPVITFDLSNSQEAASPNSLTHLNAFSSLRTKQKSSLELISSSTPCKKSKEADSEGTNEGNNLNYSLETWDNFLGNAIDTQTIRNINDQTVVFESLNSEPQSLIFIEADGGDSTVTPPNSDMELSLEGGFLEDVYSNQTINIQEECNELNKTFEVEESELNKTYDVSTLEGSFSMEECASDEQDESGTWDSSGGWFLHPQSSGSVSGQITEQRDVRSMDDEILAALRGELLAKLPHAQGSTNDKLKENNDDWDQNDKEEVFLRYNVYNTPLSPIPEESENDEESDYVCTATGSPASGASDDWPEKLLENAAPQENDSQSLKAQGLHHQRTLSQDSYCSNDTLFNLEDMTYVVADQDDDESDKNADQSKKLEEERIRRDAIDYFKMGTAVGMPLASPVTDLESPLETAPDKAFLEDFLVREREHSEMVSVVVTEPLEDDSHSAPRDKTAAPLPSPDDHPWKQLSDSLLRKGLLEADHKVADEEESPDSTTYGNKDHVYVNQEEEEGEETETELYSNVIIEDDLPGYVEEVPDSSMCHNKSTSSDHVYENVDQKEEEKIALYTNVDADCLPSYVNVDKEAVGAAVYENVEGVGDILNEEDYVNITNLENAKISADLGKGGSLEGDENPEYVQLDDDLIIRSGEEDQDDQIFGVLTDIRFSGPGEPHLMSTSFSESNEMQNEQDWESGSDTRSSSSGEFIWRLDDIEPDKGSKEETSSESSCSDDEGECPEFIPSAWDKYATPTKSALRSPEKTLEKEEKKKGVWFKKQRYHCVYEYPKEPESPVLQSFDLWNNPPPATSYPEWYFDIDSNTEFNDFTTTTNFSDGDALSTDFTTTTFNNEFFVTGSATPFDMMTGTSSQFFPGGDHWSDTSKLNENTTPDSGVEDVTPGSMDRLDLAGMAPSNVPSLKLLSEAAYARLKLKAKENKTNEILGGLRHTRNKLKLDLPSSPNTFTANKTFNLEPNVEPVVIRERPAFTTFGKSRFLVQHVDTPDKDATGRNVCFEALPYKPIEKKEQETKTKKVKKEEEKGEASLLDSADEDSGIESSTLERKSCDAGKLIVDL
ncbi:uncharacterized protein LOC123322999 isoform X2 [Coccinella septempunctata]|uniref:uncharacterized protein LOC123322999 isoform X2 n=1 Tax=Coccinella septempunctata TaxID=41139 RepID=UPI001D077A4F|nr:uncharacterized protein LOC123322999 isoform X2 [Coccinella septempunctata]